MVVKANYSDGTSEEINTYTVSEIDKDIIGEQTLTVSYLGKTTDLKITVKSVSRITAQTSKSTYYLGENIDKSTITVTAYYSDGTSSVLNSNEFEVTGFGNTLGKQTLTVTYLDKTAYLTIQLLDANIAALNKLYETSSTTSELTTAQIGSYAGDFTIEHTVKINSIPADGDKVMLSADTYADSHKDQGNSEVSDYNGIAIAYISYVNKVVPADYQQTEQDMKDEESGKYVFSYGAEKVEISQVQGVEWEQDGIYYNITAINSPLDKQGLIDMAKEVIDN